MLYSLVLEISALNKATIGATMGHQAHALFLDLVRQTAPELAMRLHDEPGYRPFTISPLTGGRQRGDTVELTPGQLCRLRVTLLDGGPLWQNLSRHFLEAGPLKLRLGAAEFALQRVLSTPSADPTGWAAHSDWEELAATPPCTVFKFRFASPTAFNLGNKHFALFPEPLLLWDSFLRVWNIYAPTTALQIDKTELREFVSKEILVSDYELQTATLRFPTHLQKGCVGTCLYRVRRVDNPQAKQVAALAAFAQYGGAGHKTTMGMGQLRLEQ